MIDNGQMRRNQPCWYKLSDVQSLAVNDAFMILTAVFVILKEFFAHLPCYVSLLELLHETYMYTFIGQSLDYQMSKCDITSFTMEIYRSINDYKSAYYGVYVPVVMPMILAG